MSGPRTSGTGSGLSGDWTTPQAHDTNPRSAKNRANPNGGCGCLTWDAREASWPTPRSEDSDQTGSHRGEPDTLTSAARLWSTPNSHDAERGAESKATKDARGAGGVNLREACNWPTPKSRGVKGMSQRGIHKPEDALLNMVNAGLPAPASPSTNGKRRDWCTPGASLAEAGTQSRGGDRKHELLLNGQARAESPRAGSLNPAWVAQLQGFPDGWLDLPEEALSAPSVTPSSRKSRK